MARFTVEFGQTQTGKPDWVSTGESNFKSTRTVPAQPVQETLAQVGELLKALSA